MRAGRVFVLTGAVIALAGCDLLSAPERPAETSGEANASGGAFSHSQSEDLSGYYRPTNFAGMDDFELSQIFVGQARAFQAWEDGARGVAPVVMEFTVLGGETLRVMPDRYSVSDNRLFMSGTVASVGEVSIDARLDPGALATARRNLGEEGPVMRGSLKIGGASSPVALAWYGGD